MDDVVEAPYCVVCRRSSAVKWRKHVFSRGHQQAAQQFLLRQATRLQALCDSTTAARGRCDFCDITAAARAHFGGEGHKKQVEAFCRQHRCDAERQLRPQLWLRRRELEAALMKREADNQKEKRVEAVDQAVSERVEAFLSSAASRLQEVQVGRCVKATVVETAEQKALLGPQLTEVRRSKTVTSAEGVLQNPRGRLEGKRVWGGGIVKLRKTEWIPWAIDQLVKDEQTDHPEMQQTRVDNTFAHRVTEVARGEGLSSIASVSWGAGVRNMHTAAVPPWMVGTEEEYKKCNRREQAPTFPNNKTEAMNTKKRDILSELQSKSEYGSDWLPNFGGVWQEGPRSKTKQAFRKAASVVKSSRGRPSAQSVVINPSLVEIQAPVQRPSPAIAHQTQPLPPCLPPQMLAVHHSVPVKVLSTAPILPSPVPCNDDKIIKSTNPLDAKMQLLLAQKERLRAKMAARRR
ncbi:hypothetical protein PHMEG_0005928 [Phytophthora megakarya]|uniref:U1-type domain-containing protein n=1 Tax=Phytophthora megakarya TaxID=4795 RepID=A0A225WS35_9STRA|nr:hypothetical protein PHMEG_0005928 [Phytophthora megakarya]